MSILTIFILLSGFLLRTLIPEILPHLTNILDKFVLLSTPINSYRSLNEGIFLMVNNMDPYTDQGQILHHPPLVLHLFNSIKTSPLNDNLMINVFFAMVDSLIAIQLIKLNSKFNTGFKSYQIALFYVFNPMTIVSTLSKSTYLLNNLIIISMLNCTYSKKFNISMALLGLSTYLAYYSWYLSIPIAYFIYLDSKSISKPIKSVLVYLSSLGLLLLTSFKITNNSWTFINLCYGSIIKFEKITPNIGLWWYFFTEIFEFFSSFYIGLFNIYTFIFTIPLTIRFIDANDVSSVIFTIWTIIGFTTFGKGYPCLTDYSLVYTIIIVFRKLFSELKFSLLIIYVSLMVVMVLSPIFYFVWMAFNSGNANFFYAIGLALNVLQMLILTDFIWAKIKLEYFGSVDDDATEKSSNIIKLTQI